MATCCQTGLNQRQQICYCSRYWEVPMTVYYGPGYTPEDSLQAIQESLQQISQTLTCICSRMG